jgi:preprotein translocase subunit SecD
MIAAVFIQGATAVRLGLDLRGGTSVTLQPRVSQGSTGAVTTAAVDQAVSIIRQRVNSLGVAESEVTAQGSGANRQIVISVPGDTGDILSSVGQTAELRFRQVLAEGSGLPAAGGGDTATVTGVDPAINNKYATLDCTKPESRQGTGTDAPTDIIVTCDRAGITKFILAPAEVLGRQVTKATAAIDQQGAGGWYVLLSFNGEGTKAFGALTTRVTKLTTPTNQVAIVLDGLVVSSAAN